MGGKSGVEACVALHQIEFSWSASKTHRLHVSPTINADYLKNKKESALQVMTRSAIPKIPSLR